VDYIQGEGRDQAVLFTERLDKYIAEESVVRVIDGLDISGTSLTTYLIYVCFRPPYPGG